MRRMVAVGALLACASCSAAGHPSSGAVVSWWKDPGSSPNRPAYCAMLSQTLSAHTAGLHGTQLVATTRAWVKAVQSVAPEPVHGAWLALGPAVIGLAAGSPSGASATVVSAASRTIDSDAQVNCHISLAT